MEPSEQERATEWVTPAEVMAKMNAVSRQPAGEGARDQRRAASTLRGGLGTLESYAPACARGVRAAGCAGKLVPQGKHVSGQQPRPPL